MGKPKLKWSEKGEQSDFDAARDYLSLLAPTAKAEGLVRALRAAKPIERAAKDLLRAAQAPLLPQEDPHVAEDLKRIDKAKPLSPVLLVRGEMAKGFPLTIADGYHRICAVVYSDESAPIRCRLANEED